jgi:hypothetical protein
MAINLNLRSMICIGFERIPVAQLPQEASVTIQPFFEQAHAALNIHIPTIECRG